MRGTGVVILLCIVTLGIYSLVYYFATHEEMKRHSGEGLGGGLGLLWVIPGALLIIGPIIWLVKTNGALNAHWRSLGAS